MENEIQESIVSFLGHQFGAEKFSPRITYLELEKLFAPFKQQISALGAKIISITGTNGKGETAYTLSSLVTGLGLKCATWTSPHIVYPSERLKMNSCDIGGQRFRQLIQKTADILGPNFTQLSYYEFLFFCFAQYVILERPEVLILEVGLGGRLDAINLCDADCVLVTSLGRDHTEFLGPDYRSILHEKIQLARQNGLVISNLSSQYFNELLIGEQQELKFKLWPLGLEIKGQSPANGSDWPYYKANRYLALAALQWLIHCRDKGPGVGPFQSVSFDQLDLLYKKMESSFLTYNSRREMVTYNGKGLIFIGAHNLEGMRVLGPLIKDELFQGSKQARAINCFVSFSKRPDSEIRAMVKILLNQERVNGIYITGFNHPKAASLNQLQKIFQDLIQHDVSETVKKRLIWVEDWRSFLKNEEPLKQTGIKDEGFGQKLSEENFSRENWLVAGSYYFIGEVKKFIGSSHSLGDPSAFDVGARC